MYHYDPNIQLKRILIVGIGGTGAVIARHTGSLLFDMQQRNLDTPEVYLIDGDLVEPANCGRQPFAHCDVGAAKAQIIAQRLNYSLGLDFSYANRMFVAADWQPHHHRYLSTLVVSCVDNHLARREIARLKGAIWLDLGNHFSSGQVCIGDRDHSDGFFDSCSRGSKKLAHLPNPGLLLPELLEAEPAPDASHLSCADRLERGSQHLLINQMMGTVGAACIHRLLHRQPISSFISHVSISPPAVHNELITQDNLSRYLRRETP